MVTIGAIYSDALGLNEVRWLMEVCKRAVNRSFGSLKLANFPTTEPSGIEVATDDIEEIQAMILLQIMFIWHGNKQQRHQAREEFWKLANVARIAGLLHPIAPDQLDCSILHQPSYEQLNATDIASWNWSLWINQEKRIRAMFLIYLVDCALVIFFNRPPEFAPSEIRIQLPADDAAWEAESEDACMNALGLNGSDIQQRENQSGSGRSRQLEFHICLNHQMALQQDLAPRSTNIYSKFILIHALHVKIWKLQHQPAPAVNAFGGASSEPGTPLNQDDWVVIGGNSGALSHPNSGRATPTESHLTHYSPQHQQETHALMYAVEKWKRAWDLDIDLQYPPSGSPIGTSSVRRVGFCRDAIHYYFLAKQFLTNYRALNAREDPDTRMNFVMKTLKQIRNYVGSENYQQGRELGSVVGMDDHYGVDDLTLNMALLFTDLGMGGVESEGTMQHMNGLLQ